MGTRVIKAGVSDVGQFLADEVAGTLDVGLPGLRDFGSRTLGPGESGRDNR